MAKVEIEDLGITPNSNTYKKSQERKREKIDPIKRKGKIVSTKKSFGKRMWDLFVGQDPKDLAIHFVNDVLIPGVKYAVLDAISVGFFGEVFDGRRRSSGGRYDYRGAYGRVKSSGGSSRKRDTDYVKDERVDYRNIKLDNRYDAEEVVDRLKQRIYDTGSVSIAELFDLLELPSRFTDNDWGWTDERDIGIRMSGRDFLIDVAEAKHLD